MSEPEYCKQDIADIAKFQRFIYWLFLLGPIFWVSPVYYLARSLKVKRPWLYAVGIFVPIANLFVLLGVIRAATKVLRAKNIRVGIMGAKKEDVNSFLTSVEKP